MEITIKLDQRKKEVKALIEYLKNLPYIELEFKQHRYNAETEKVINEARKGKNIIKTRSHEDLMKILND
jgi:antitoxin component of RelBE/YafQ-DinJ toxin-antitoxin module